MRCHGLDPFDYYPLPRPPVPAPQPGSFMLLPLGCGGLPALQYVWQLAVYQHALAQAQAIARPSLLERDLLAVWN